MNHYRCSNGTKVSKSFIDKKVHEAKEIKLTEQLDFYGFNFCTECQEIISSNNAVILTKINEMDLKILDCSHIESVDSCQKNGHSEKAWDLNNIRILCRFHHRKHDHS